MTTLVWFRQDLRVADNPALTAAVQAQGAVVPVFIFAPAEERPWSPGSASRWWLHHSLARLADDLEKRGSRLTLRAGPDSLAILTALVKECGATRVLWNRRYEPAIIARDRKIKEALRGQGIDAVSFNSALLYEPWTVRTKTGGPFQVFTPFWRHCKSLPEPGEPLAAPLQVQAPERWPESESLQSLALLPRVDWAAGLRAAWTPGSAAAQRLLQRFLAEGFAGYGSLRDQPGVRGTSRLSPYLHFGELGPREIWHATRRMAGTDGDSHSDRDVSPVNRAAWRDSKFLAELGWREFAHHLLYHFPETPEKPLRKNYAGFPWKRDPEGAEAWTRGATGYPLVDAGLRELWHTGWMHNRVRMVAGSFLIKDLLIDWTHGARWFWDTLVDADLASNTLGWQWVAGCGADAAPFFRIFNPTSQGAKFDPDGEYIRRWVPELARLPDAWIHQPWDAPAAVLQAAGVSLGEHYPHRIVDHDRARREALDALAAIKS